MNDKERTGVVKSIFIPASELEEFKRTHDVITHYPRPGDQYLVVYIIPVSFPAHKA